MKKQRTYVIAAILLFAAIALAVPQFAQAANTTAGITISNQAKVNYTVGTVPQTEVPGNTVTFVVDRVIYLTVTKQSDVSSAPSSTFQAIQFLVTNGSNTAMRFALSAVEKAAAVTLTGVNIYRDNNNDAKYDAGDTQYTDAGTFNDIASGATITVLIVGDMPAAPLANGLTAVWDLVATAVDAGTLTVPTETAGTKDASLNVVMTIFGDAAGSAVGDGARDGKHSASGTFTVSAAGLTVNKTAVVYSDPVNLLVNPKAIPQAVITYTVTVTNAAGGAAATNVVITDDLSAMITAGNIAISDPFSDASKTCVAGQISVISTDSGVSWTCQNGTWNSGTNTLTVSGLDVNAGSDVRIKYQVTIP